jgi:Putative peptidoglycan binding domain
MNINKRGLIQLTISISIGIISIASIIQSSDRAVAGYSRCSGNNQYSRFCFKKGDSGTKIQQLSIDLINVGYYKGKPTKIFNQNVENAVKKFQADYASRGIKKTNGTVDEETLLVICQASRKGCSSSDGDSCYTGSPRNVTACLDTYK